ncbi:uncharacterized protein LOC124361721 isoform X3 [Homalodisca vitripennis]|uniref:uncharacterized protein LOC124361721 isoform X3 n=1 Tax=Homalodisca vitripennis TaxID=197043 RepID=UPI001EE9D642|nr:uncharacterized protein LOC124361721 isoform X3 [Homalodisca vitripennis]
MSGDWEQHQDNTISENDNLLGTPFTHKDGILMPPSLLESMEGSEFDNEGVEKDAGIEEQEPDNLMFEPLDEEGERYLRENMKLPPIGELSLTKYYINFHPSKSDTSSSVNSVGPWWSQVEYDDLEACECLTVRRPPKKVEILPLQPKARTYPRTLELLQERRVIEQKNQEHCRSQAISNLERHMVSLYNLKHQYKRSDVRGGCRGAPVSLPPLVVPDKLTLQRDALLARIKRKMFEDESKKQQRMERRLDIVKKILGEQRRRVFRREFDKRSQRKEDVTKRDVSLIEAEEKQQFVDDLMSGQDDSYLKGDEYFEFVESIPQSEQHELEHPETSGGTEMTESPRKVSGKKQKDKKKKSLKNSEKKGAKKKNKISPPPVVAAAICEAEPELPASEVPDLLLWCKDRREVNTEYERQVKYLESQMLPLETNVVMSQTKVIFPDVRPGERMMRQVTVTNVGQSLLNCRVAGVQFAEVMDSSPIFKVELEGSSRARTGNGWTLLLTLEALDDVEDTRVEVRLLFCRDDSARSQLSVGVEVLTPRAKPSLSTSYIRFGSQVFWSPKVLTKQLEISNTGSLGCEVRWLSVNDYADETRTTQVSGQQDNDADVTSQRGSSLSLTSDAARIGEEMVDIALRNVFDVFRVSIWQPTWLPPKSQITVPVTFVPGLAPGLGEVFSKFNFTFEGKNVDNPSQDLIVCGRLEDSVFRVKPIVLDLRVCYLGGVQQGQFSVYSAARAVTSVYARVPRPLAPYVAVLPSQTLIQARSATTLTVRLVLRDFPTQCSDYLDPATGLLSFSVQLAVGPAPCPPLELPVVALVAPPCPLSLAPALLDLGQVSTYETLFSPVTLTNHNTSCPYNYAFVDLPQGVMIEPCAGHGTILPGETLSLDLLYSPKAKDIGVACGRPGDEGEVNFTLRCFTTASMAAPMTGTKKQRSLLPRNDVTHEEVKISSVHEETPSCCSDEGDREAADLHALGIVDVEDDISELSMSMTSTNVQTFEDEVVDASDEQPRENNTSIHTLENESKQLASETELQWNYYSSFLVGAQDFATAEQSEITQEFPQSFNEDEYGQNPEQETPFPDSASLKEDNVIQQRKRESANITNNQDITSNRDSVETIEKEDKLNLTVSTRSYENSEQTEEVYSDQITSRDVTLPNPGQQSARIDIRAYVVDPLVELSSQRVILPQTPCNSFSLVHIYIRSRVQKKCNFHCKRTAFKTSFEFRSSYEHLRVEPRCGSLGYKERVKIALVFNPILSQKEIFNKAFEMKIESMKWSKIQELLEQHYLSKAKQQSKKSRVENTKASTVIQNKSSLVVKENKETKSRGGSAKSKLKGKGSVATSKTKKSKLSIKTTKLKKKESGPLADVIIDPADVEVTEDDLRSAESWLLKYMEPQTRTETLYCLLETELGNETRRKETLECVVVCPMEAPAIVLSSSACLDFGPRALGSTSKMRAEITNISFFDATVRVSTLDPVGQFMCPAPLETTLKINGERLELPPEHILSVPILFMPTLSIKVVERFEVRSETTVLNLQVRGEGVTPSFTFNPDREIFPLTSGSGKKADFVITVENTCTAPLNFQIKKKYLREGSSLLSIAIPSSPQSPAGKDKQKIKPKKEKKTDSDFQTLTPELDSCLDNEFTDMKEDNLAEPVFKILEVDEKKLLQVNEKLEISVGEVKKIIIRFTPPLSIKSETDQKDRKLTGTPSGKPKKDKEMPSGKKKKSVKNESIDTGNTENTKKKKEKVPKKDRAVSEKSLGKENEIPSKKIFAVKYEVLLSDSQKVKDWVFIGTTKK